MYKKILQVFVLLIFVSSCVIDGAKGMLSPRDGDDTHQPAGTVHRDFRATTSLDETSSAQMAAKQQAILDTLIEINQSLKRAAVHHHHTRCNEILMAVSSLAMLIASIIMIVSSKNMSNMPCAPMSNMSHMP